MCIAYLFSLFNCFAHEIDMCLQKRRLQVQIKLMKSIFSIFEQQVYGAIN